MGTPVDAEHLCKDHLDTWGRPEGKNKQQPHRPRPAPMPETQKSRETTAPRTLSTRGTYKQAHPDTWNTEEKQ